MIWSVVKVFFFIFLACPVPLTFDQSHQHLNHWVCLIGLYLCTTYKVCRWNSIQDMASCLVFFYIFLRKFNLDPWPWDVYFPSLVAHSLNRIIVCTLTSPISVLRLTTSAYVDLVGFKIKLIKIDIIFNVWFVKYYKAPYPVMVSESPNYHAIMSGIKPPKPFTFVPEQ